ncbi:ABC transporter ATP-binding protein [Phaeodactylibacter sp.]|uniref:ABC transporter ATP-binding protein n=1 Tax=Phaeodactylibacter sp. TaxID=1940289 RepID=UPI0025EBCFCE|nr:ABC transporter ATP-binding protein [Phaeodactylibacter sp.]MCI4649573.1 ABC transporter ATP-binding protein/permease [Phaeodactylibacter sp.]MCI5089427.1 ABC transporter ATP-binding protein/permease [Phaeodactylibacter sp.]
MVYKGYQKEARPHVKQLAYLNKFFFRYKKHFLLGILFVSLSNYFRVLQPQMIREALDLVVENIGLFGLLNGFELQPKLYSILGRSLLYFGVLVLLFALLMGIFMYFMRQTIIVMSRLIEYDMRKEIFQKYEDLSMAFYKRNKTGDMMSRITEDVSKVRMYLGPAILYGINLVSLFVLVIYSMLQVNVELTLYALAPLPILSVSIYYVSNLINKKSEVIQQQLAHLNTNAQEIYSGIRVVKSYVQEVPMLSFFRKESDIYRDKALDLAKVNAFFYPLMVLLIGASTVITVYIGGLQVVRGSISTGNIAEFVIYVNMLTWPVTAIGWIASIIQQAAASQKRINEFLSLEPEITNHTDTKTDEIRGNIAFDRVSFVYPDTGTQALKDVSFELKAGQKMAIIGKTGSGKSTIADLLVRMYDVEQGRITVDGKDVRDHNLFQLRRAVGYVPQDVFLFSDTIAHNIAFGKRDASREEVEEYARYAAVHDDIMELSNGFDTFVGERGVTLSGGQKQRVSIARAFLKQPDIVLLDDCLSAVDTKTEQQILGYLSGALSNKTAIIITHRIYSLLEFDKILVLEDGRIAESGTHDELIKMGGYYSEMVEKQRLEEVDEGAPAR